MRIQHSAVVLDARTCAWLEKYANLTSLRVRVRGTDPAISRDLEDIRTSAMAWRASATGSPQAPQAEAGPQSPWMSTSGAADLLRVTGRRVRQMVASGLLDAEQVDGRWRISREAIAHYRAAQPEEE